MSAPEGNKFYRLRNKDGRNKIFETPKDLAIACDEYFEWAETNPIKEQNIFHSNGIITKTDLEKKRPFTIKGLCLFLNITEDTFRNYGERKDFLEVITHARNIIFNQKFEGAAVNIFNSSIIARDLGLVDKKEQTIKEEPRVFKID